MNDTAQEPPSMPLPRPVGSPPSAIINMAPDEEAKYAFPMGPDQNGDFGVEDIDWYIHPLYTYTDILLTHVLTFSRSMSSNTSTGFQELCRQFHLPHYGSKAERRERLIHFSKGGMEKWRSSLLLPARISHKGVRSGGITKPSNTSPVGFSIQHSKDTQTQAEIDGIIPWCHRVLVKIANALLQVPCHTHLPKRRVNNMPYRKPSDSDLLNNRLFAKHVAAIVEAQLAARASSTDITMASFSPCPSVDFDTTSLGLTAHSVNIVDDVDRPDSPTIPFKDLTLESAALPSMSLPLQVMACPPLTEPLGTAASDATSSSSKLCVLLFADDIQKLIASWDDGSLEWNPPSDHPIVIHGHDIPVRLWKELYCYNRTTGDEWKQLKNEWTNWQYFMKAYQALTPDMFWAKYSDTRGQRLSYSRISTLLLAD
ncbi:uncharacterized protein EV420DRAFT_1711369 [Desarmillaria tabescens]|uniref:SAP domain-containing protein n=1 Tax=Armillaria tabescens TaxID=1929756 RepID=A0AA39JYN3_ARMTA|nr:uncharacterized protein EV420DRAFT_1711369 [Desarmillaria tabescens]KAK0448993.1 hypothetical protein EV420DRAFT_1711369 [Desarmillaria tabescens]